jgi:hypothetical protein
VSDHDDALEVASARLAADAGARDNLFAAALRVWSNNRDRDALGYKEFAALGDVLYHLSDGAFGRCEKYDSEECLTEDEQRARWGAPFTEMAAMPPEQTIDGDFGPLPTSVLGRLTQPYSLPPDEQWGES